MNRKAREQHVKEQGRGHEMSIGISEREGGGWGQSFPPINHRTALLDNLRGIHIL